MLPFQVAKTVEVGSWIVPIWRDLSVFELSLDMAENVDEAALDIDKERKVSAGL